jgi:hypothetical protein
MAWNRGTSVKGERCACCDKKRTICQSCSRCNECAHHPACSNKAWGVKVFAIGDKVGELVVGSYTIEKVVSRIAYARNGNAHNPTTYYEWILKMDGRLMDRFISLRDAKAAAKSDDYI